MFESAIKNINSVQNDIESAFILDCDAEDLKEFREARRCQDVIRRNRKLINHVTKVLKLNYINYYS